MQIKTIIIKQSLKEIIQAQLRQIAFNQSPLLFEIQPDQESEEEILKSLVSVLENKAHSTMIFPLYILTSSNLTHKSFNIINHFKEIPLHYTTDGHDLGDQKESYHFKKMTLEHQKLIQVDLCKREKILTDFSKQHKEIVTLSLWENYLRTLYKEMS